MEERICLRFILYKAKNKSHFKFKKKLNVEVLLLCEVSMVKLSVSSRWVCVTQALEKAGCERLRTQCCVLFGVYFHDTLFV